MERSTSLFCTPLFMSKVGEISAQENRLDRYSSLFRLLGEGSNVNHFLIRSANLSLLRCLYKPKMSSCQDFSPRSADFSLCPSRLHSVERVRLTQTEVCATRQ